MDTMHKVRAAGLLIGGICGIGGGSVAIHYGLNQSWKTGAPTISLGDHQVNMEAVQNNTLAAYGAVAAATGIFGLTGFRKREYAPN